MSVKKDMTDDVNKIIKEFHNHIFKVLKICNKLEPNNIELKSLQGKLSIARDSLPFLIIDRCKDKVWLHREHIITKNEDFFLQNKFLEYIKDDENKSFMHSMIDLIKCRYREMSDSEKKIVWNLIQAILKSIVEYKTAIGDFV